MRSIRPVAAAGLLLAATAALGGSASAHVTIPDPGEKGGFSIVTLSVPNERPDASTISLEVQLPPDHPLPFVSVQPKPGWTAETTMRTLDEPIEAFGEEVTEVVDTVTWTGGEIGPGEFDTFALSVGPLPEDADRLPFPAIQTYSSDEEVAWIEETQEGSEEPEHPAPVLRLVEPEDAGDGDDATTATTLTADEVASASDSEDDDGTDGVAIAALVISVLAAVAAGAALLTRRRG